MNKMANWTKFTGAAALATVWALSAGVAPASAQTAWEKIKSQGKITIGIHNHEPWGYLDASGKVTGFSPDLVRAAFEPLGIKQIDYVTTDFGALIPGLTSRRFDAVASGLFITPERCKSVAFSEPDLTLKDAVLVKKGNPLNIHSFAEIAKNDNLILGATRGSVNGKNAAAAGVPPDRLTLFQDTSSTIAALVSGRVNAITFSVPTVIAFAKDPNIGGIERADPFVGLVVDGKETAGYSGIAFRQDEQDLKDVYNKRLAEMKADGTVTKIMSKYGFSKSENPPDLTAAQICGGAK